MGEGGETRRTLPPLLSVDGISGETEGEEEGLDGFGSG